MKQRNLTIVLCITLCGTVLTAGGREISDQAEFPQISEQPTDRDVPLGGSTVLTIQSTNADSFQWYRNGVPLAGETNSTLTLENVTVADVGYYSSVLIKGTEVLPTRSAAVTIYAMSGGGGLTIYALPVAASGTSGSCPGAYAGYVNYTKTVSQGWGWAPSTNTTVHTASDLNRTDTKVVYLGKYGDNGCAQTTVTVPHPTASPKYRFTIYFPNNVPTNSYAITLNGFDP